VTVARDNLPGLQETLTSVRRQTTTDGCEHIVVDGGSTDGTVQYLNALSVDYPILRFISEVDSGIYDAMNKGLAMARGDYILFLNAGDSLVTQDVVEQLVPVLGEASCEWLVGRVLDMGGESSGVVSDNLPFSVERFWCGRQTYCHQGTIFTTAALRRTGG